MQLEGGEISLRAPTGSRKRNGSFHSVRVAWHRSVMVGGGELLDRVSKRSGVVLDPRISRHDGHQLWRLAEQFCGRKRHGIEVRIGSMNVSTRPRTNAAKRRCDDSAYARAAFVAVG